MPSYQRRVVFRDGRIANYHAYLPASWNASPREQLRPARPARPCEDSVQDMPLFEENGPDDFNASTSRAIRRFDPCLPCGVHMSPGSGRELQARHVPMLVTSP